MSQSSKDQEQKPIKGKKVQKQILDKNLIWDSKKQYEVEKILDEDVHNGQTHFLIKWKGYDIFHSTWEREDKISHLAEMIEEFRKGNQNKSKKAVRYKYNALMNPYQAIAFHGHYLYGDQAKAIASTRVQFDEEGKKTIYLEVQWEPRKNHDSWVNLQNTFLESDTIMQHDPDLLLNYYASSLRISPPPEP